MILVMCDHMLLFFGLISLIDWLNINMGEGGGGGVDHEVVFNNSPNTIQFMHYTLWDPVYYYVS